MRILIAVPTFETIYPDTYKSIWDLDKCGHEVLFDSVRGYDVVTCRPYVWKNWSARNISGRPQAAAWA